MGKKVEVKHSTFSIRLCEIITIGRVKFSFSTLRSKYKWLIGKGVISECAKARDSAVESIEWLDRRVEFVTKNSDQLRFFGFRIFKNQNYNNYYHSRKTIEERVKYLKERHPERYHSQDLEIFEKIMAIFPHNKYNTLKKSRSKTLLAEKLEFDTIYNRIIQQYHQRTNPRRGNTPKILVSFGDWKLTEAGLMFDRMKIWEDQAFYMVKLFGNLPELKTAISINILEHY